MSARKISFRFLLLLGVAWLTTLTVAGEKLPFRVYTTADGLAHDSVHNIVRDSRGFLWFCTSDGLSRFNGYTFKSYTQEQGLPHRSVIDLVETNDGTYLISTAGGLVVFDPLGRAYRWNLIEGKLEKNAADQPMFTTYLPPGASDVKNGSVIVSLGQAADGTIYAGTTHGFFEVKRPGSSLEFHRIEPDVLKITNLVVNYLVNDLQGAMWVIANGGIFRILRDRRIVKVSDIGGNYAFADREGRIWVDSGGNDVGLRVFTPDADTARLVNTFTTKDGLRVNTFTRAVAETGDGRIFVMSQGVLGQYLPDAPVGAPKFRFFESELIENAATDSGGNLWFGTNGKGAWKLSLNGFVSYGAESGLSTEPITALFFDRSGRVLSATQSAKTRELADGQARVIQPAGFPGRSYNYTFLDHQAQDGEWWLPSTNGLYRYPATTEPALLARQQPRHVYTTADGLFGNAVFALFEDSRRDLWISASDGTNCLHRWDRASDKIIRYTTEDGIKTANGGASSFGEDAAGDIWISFFFAGLVRFRGGRFQAFTAADGIPEGSINDFLSDAQGRFWIATRSRGLFRVDDPSVDHPHFRNISTADGLLSNETNCLTADRFGRIYVGTGRGLNRLDPATNAIRSYSQADGLPGSYVAQCRTDPNGTLWLAGSTALARFVPQPDAPTAAPPVFIDGVSINGVPQRVSELGASTIQGLELGSNQTQLRIDFFALGFGSGETLRYQYRVNDQEWSAPSGERSVALSLAAGSYRFAVRAVTADGVISPEPAIVAFHIARPVWQRWWFVTLMLLVVAGAVLALERYRAAKARQLQRVREERIAELQRVRTRIATDLHDDIGSSLTQIAVYSELARQREAENGRAGESLDQITHVAGELVDTMSDIVWAINPRKDHLQDLTQRMRRFAANALSAQDIDFEFTAPDTDSDLPLGANVRREVFLIFKETVNNIVKHAGAKAVRIDFRLHNSVLDLTFTDDGRGFDPQQNGHPEGQEWKKFRGGNGLLNMKKRAAELGGTYLIDSTVGQGTTVSLRIPLDTAIARGENTT